MCVWTRESGLGLRRPKPITCRLDLVCHGWGPLFISILPRRRVTTVTFRKTITWALRGCAQFCCRLPGLLGVTADFEAQECLWPCGLQGSGLGSASRGQGEREDRQPDHRGSTWAAVQHQPPESSYQHPQMAKRRWAVIAGSAQEAAWSLQSIFTTCEPRGWCWLGGK